MHGEGISFGQRKLKAKNKLDSATTYLKQNLEASYSCSMKESPLKSLSSSENLGNYKIMMQELKDAFIECNSYKRKLQILTISPYTLRKTAHFFNTTIHMVKQSRKLKKEHEILPEGPTTSKGKSNSTEEKATVQIFYESDEVSRMCPGQKDCLKVRDAQDEKVLRQKRLILGNLKELFQLYQTDQSNPKVGFSTFARLRPPHCVLAGSGGTHCVCVCGKRIASLE